MPLTAPVLNKKSGIEYWEQFPLDSVENIRRWQQDCTEGSLSSQLPEGYSSRLADALQPTTDVLAPAQSLPIDDQPTQQEWSSLYDQGGEGAVVGQQAPEGTGAIGWNDPTHASEQMQGSELSQDTFSGQKIGEDQDKLKGSSFYPTEFQRQFFW